MRLCAHVCEDMDGGWTRGGPCWGWVKVTTVLGQVFIIAVCGSSYCPPQSVL